METTAVPLAHQAACANENMLAHALQRMHKALPADPSLAHAMPLPDVVEALQDERLAAIEVFAKACEAYADRPAFGERAFQVDGTVIRFQPAFRTITYRVAWHRTVDLASGLVHDPRTALRPGEIAGIYGFGSIDYAIADLACLYAGVVSAVLQMGMGAEDLQHLATEARYACLISSREGLPAMLALAAGCPSVRCVVVMDLHAEATEEAADLRAARARADLPLATLAELAAAGRRAAPLSPFLPPRDADPLATLMYTSGSTGFPKGALLTQRIWRSHWLLTYLEQYLRFPQIGINFYPLSHALGRNALLRSLLLGGVMNFTLKSDLSTLFEDIRLVRPTTLNLVPRISEMIHQAFRGEVRRLEKAGRTVAAAEAEVMDAMRSTFLGDRLVALLVGSAPTAPEVLSFLSRCFEVPVYEGFGSTEAGVITQDGEICRASVLDYKLIEVPELGYRLDDRPHPRGELLVKTRHSIPGYFQNPEATRALYDPDGFLRTGDIVEATAPGHVAWIDRKGNVVKLAQGEFVTLWRLEALFSAGSPFLDQVYLYANSLRAYPLAVAVPDWTAVNERLRGTDHAPAAVKRLLRAEFNRIAAAAGLRPYEVPRDFLVEHERWTRENGFLTGINKPARPGLKRRYGPRLETLYAQLEDHARLPEVTPGLPLADQVRMAVEAVLGVPDLDLAAGSFKDFGGDSISALALATLLEEVCGKPVPVASLLNPGVPLQALVGQLEALLGPEAPPTFLAIHPGVPRAEDLRLARLLDPAGLQGAGAVATQTLPIQVGTVLLTGATGFLGHHLCLAWLEQVAQAGGKVIALVRAPHGRAAAERLQATYRSDPDLERRFASAADGHLEVLAGDFTLPRLGLDEETYGRLARDVDLIVHPGALVNHVYTYEQLFEPNVLGTAHLIRLALQHRRKRFDQVSTLGVLAGASLPGRVPERAGVGALQTEWPPRDDYAYGYAASKWAGEVLLKDLHDRYGTPVRVFRPGMILPHRRYRGQVNVPDMLTRLLVSLVQTGLAPRSFYAGGRGPAAHYDGLPVDFVAASMVALSSARHEGHATYQMSNPHWCDGISLDSLVAWVRSAGHPLAQVEEYDAWFNAFSAKVRELPPAIRQHSVLPILHQWASPDEDAGRERVDASLFRQEVERHRPAGEAGIPHLTEGFIHKYLHDLEALGLI